jgi:hypothetical protein
VPDEDAPKVSAETFAAGLSPKVLHCRELGHNWRPHVARWEADSRTFYRELRCSNCRTIRRQVLDSHGHPRSNSYAYPDGYQAKNVERGTYSRDVFRLEALMREVSAPGLRRVV